MTIILGELLYKRTSFDLFLSFSFYNKVKIQQKFDPMKVALCNILFVLALITVKCSSNSVWERFGITSIDFKRIGIKISKMINVSTPFGAQNTAVYILSRNHEAQEAGNDLIEATMGCRRNYYRPIVVGSASMKSKQRNQRFKTLFNIVVVDNLSLDQFFPIADNQSPDTIFTSKVDTVFVVLQPHEVDLSEIDSIFKKLLNRNLMNSIIVHCNIQNGKIESFNHQPFSTGPRNLRFDIFNIEFNSIFLDRDSNINGYPLRFVQYDDPPKSFVTTTDPLRGYEGMLMRILVEKMNATPLVTRLPCTERFVQLSTSELCNGTGDITVNTQFLLNGDFENPSIDFINPQITDSLNLLVHLQTSRSWGYLSVLKPYQWQVWCCLILALVIFASAWYLVKVKILKQSIKFAKIALSVGGLLTQPIQSTTERLLFAGYVLFVFIIMNGYQTVLISIFTSPSVNTFLTLKQVNESAGIEIVLPAKYELSSELTEHYLRKIVQNDFKIVRMNFWDLGKIEHNDNHVYLVHVRDGTHFTSSVANRDYNGAMMFKLLPEGLWYSMDTYATKKNFIFERRITDIVERIRQARLRDVFIPQALFEARQLGMLSKEQKGAQDKPTMVTFESLKSAFVLLLVGYVISLLAFICEVFNPKLTIPSLIYLRV